MSAEVEAGGLVSRWPKQRRYRVLVAWPVEMGLLLKLTEARPTWATYPAEDTVTPQVHWTLRTPNCRGLYRRLHVPSSGRAVQDAGGPDPSA